MIKEVGMQSLGFLCCIVAALTLDWFMTGGLGLSSQSVFTGSLGSAGLIGVACLADRLRSSRADKG
jgi:hypothetical protein